jgi:hypothetical protein
MVLETEVGRPCLQLASIHRFCPESNGIVQPSVGARADAEAKAKTDTWVFVVFDLGPGIS